MGILPEIRGPARRKPVCYDPDTDHFITIDDLEAGRAKIVPLDHLSEEQLKRLVIERNRVGENYKVQMDWAAAPYSKEDIITAIEADTEEGRVAVQADVTYLGGLLKQIEAAL